jgi:hypothetical protein
MILPLESLDNLINFIPPILAFSNFIKIYYEENDNLLIYLTIILKLVALFGLLFYFIYKYFVLESTTFEANLMVGLIQTIITISFTVGSIIIVYFSKPKKTN